MNGADLDARIDQLKAENMLLRRELHNAWLLLYRPANAFLSADAWRRHIAKLGLLSRGSATEGTTPRV